MTKAPSDTRSPSQAPSIFSIQTKAPSPTSNTQAPSIFIAPTIKVTKSPAGSITKAPIQTPVKAPVTTPVKTPVNAPVTAPVKTPVNTPVTAPVKTPVATPVKAPVQTPVSQGLTPVPSVAPTTSTDVPVVVTTSLTIQLQSVTGPLTDLTTEAFLATCSKFYAQELPGNPTDVKCDISIRRLLQQEQDHSQRLRALQVNIDVPVDVTATFAGTYDASGFDQIVLELLVNNPEEFTGLLRSSSTNPQVISYFQSVDIEGFDPTAVPPTASPNSSDVPSPTPTLIVGSSLEPTATSTAIGAMGMGMGMNMNGGMGMMMMMRMRMGMRMNGGMGMGMTVNTSNNVAAGMGMGMQQVDQTNAAKGMGMSDVATNRAWESFMEKLNGASAAQPPAASPATPPSSISAWMKLLEQLNNND